MADLSKLKTRRNSLGDPPPPEAAGKNLLAPEIAPASPDAEPADQEVVRSLVHLRPPAVPPEAVPNDLAEDELRGDHRRRNNDHAPKSGLLTPRAREVKESPRPKRIDGRTLRKTGRNVPLSLHVKAAFDEQLRASAARDSLLFSVILEQALEAYDRLQAIATRDKLPLFMVLDKALAAYEAAAKKK